MGLFHSFFNSFIIIFCINFFKFSFSLPFLKFVGLWEILAFLLNFSLKTRKKYLKEKHRSTKEKLARERTWARKHETKMGTYKGFYIPTVLPNTEQAKFFFKKWDEDEKKWRDEELVAETLKSNKSLKKNFYVTSDKKFVDSESQKTYAISKLNSTFTKKTRSDSVFANVVFKNNQNFFLISKSKKNFCFKFSKIFYKVPKIPIFVQQNFHLWSYLNIGYDSKEFLNFFFSHYFPFFFLKFNFLKVKLLILKWFKLLFKNSSYYVNKIFSNFNLILSIKKISNKIFTKNFSFLNNFFFFTNIFNNWYKSFFFKFSIKNFILNFISNQSSFTLKIIYSIFLILKWFFNFIENKKIDLYTVFFSRLVGTVNPSFLKLFSKKKKIYFLNFNYSTSISFDEFTLQFFSKFLNLLSSQKTSYHNLTNYLILIDFFFKNFTIHLKTINYFSKPLISIFFEKFSKFGLITNEQSYPIAQKLSKTFFFFLKNWIKYFENVRYLLYTSFSQQVKIIDDINVANTLFKFILRKGKKLTARAVFLRFLKKFKKKYFLPALPIFVHALLLVEPKVWLKKKKIAGKLYEIPIFISPSRSKRIAVRWLLEAAKKRKTASVTESLAQEVWDACLKWGLTHSNKETIHMTVKWNKAYLRWL